jgi:hypothetical protein
MQTPEFTKWVEQTSLLELKEAEAQAWFAENRQKYEDIYKEYWRRFQRKNPDEKAQRTLNPEDGM